MNTESSLSDLKYAHALVGDSVSGLRYSAFRTRLLSSRYSRDLIQSCLLSSANSVPSRNLSFVLLHVEYNGRGRARPEDLYIMGGRVSVHNPGCTPNGEAAPQ
jgi:hypothetical protein